MLFCHNYNTLCHNYNTLSRSNASYWLIVKLRDVSMPLKTSSALKWLVRRFKLKDGGRLM